MEQQVWSVQLARQSIVRLRVAIRGRNEDIGVSRKTVPVTSLFLSYMVPCLLAVKAEIGEGWFREAGLIGVGKGSCPPRPPNRAGSSPAHGSPVGRCLIGIGAPAHRLHAR